MNTEARQPSDMERCACTLIMLYAGEVGDQPNNILDDVVRTWALDVAHGRINSVLDNRDILNHHTNTNSWEYIGFNYDNSALKFSPGVRHWYRAMNDQIIHLAMAVLKYRDTGEGDHTTRLTTDAMGGFTVTTSLAATVVEFHHALMNAHSFMYQHEEEK